VSSVHDPVVNESSVAACIRRAAPADAAEIARLAAQFGHPVSAAELRARIAALAAMPTQYLAVAQHSSDTISGWIQAQSRLVLTSGERAEIIGLVVDAAARRLGVGTLLVEAAQQWARDAGVAEIIVRSNVVRDASHVFYLALGYSRLKTQHVYAKTLLG
jgi:GNAT superfamily N-acetyltransferase